MSTESGHSADCRQEFGSDATGLDACFMAEAMALARATQCRTWPNPPVGAVVVQNGHIVGRGTHQGPGQLHAEPQALAEAGDAALGATLYVTLEPCNHQGRTGPCAPAIFAAGIRRVVVAVRDLNPTVSGGGCRYLRDRGLDVHCGILAPEALELIWPFVTTDNFSRPYVELKTATSLDGFFAPSMANSENRAPIFLTGLDARIDVHCRRRKVDVVLVGEATVIADDPRLDGRLVGDRKCVPQDEPQAAYLDTDLSWAGGFRRETYLVFAGQGSEQSPNRKIIENDGGQIVFCKLKNGRLDLSSVLAELKGRGLLAVMVEGGPTLAASFLQDGLIDRWIQYTAPVILGAGVTWPIQECSTMDSSGGFTLTQSGNLGGDLLAVYDKQDFAAALAKATL